MLVSLELLVNRAPRVPRVALSRLATSRSQSWVMKVTSDILEILVRMAIQVWLENLVSKEKEAKLDTLVLKVYLDQLAKMEPTDETVLMGVLVRMHS